MTATLITGLDPAKAAHAKALDAMPLDELAETFGQPYLDTHYAQPQGFWTPAEDEPPLAGGPAEMQAAGRCAAARLRGTLANARTFLDNIHREECVYCPEKLMALLRVLDWAAYHARYVTAEIASWPVEGSSRWYLRDTGRSGQYDNPQWRAFYAGITPTTIHAPALDRRGWSVARKNAITAAARP